MRYFESILDTIGNTPLVKLPKIMAGVPCLALAKLEMMNPGGSVKDRIGERMIEDAEARGLLKPGGTIIEPTSGNTGLGLAMVAAIKGYRTVFTMPDKMSREKIDLLKALGARVVVTPTAVPPEHPDSYYRVAERIHRDTPNSILPDTGERYLSKAHNEEWLKEQGYLEEPVAPLMTILRAKERTIPGVITIDIAAKVREAADMMRQYNVSQLPVIDTGIMVGSLREEILMKALL